MKRTYCIIREIATDELRIASLPAGERPTADPAYRCHGPFTSAQGARKALVQKSKAAQAVLYGEGRQFAVPAGE